LDAIETIDHQEEEQMSTEKTNTELMQRLDDAWIVEENLFYDVVGMMSQLGLK
jgi:hypothetical protein